jgi:hypothetical protein
LDYIHFWHRSAADDFDVYGNNKLLFISTLLSFEMDDIEFDEY